MIAATSPPGAHPDVVVVGAGVVGLATALELVRRGLKVTVLERGSVPGAGCSSGNAGIVGASYVLPLASPESLRDGFRWLLRRDSPFSLRPRPSALPWLARFALAARGGPYQRSTAILRTLALESFALHCELGKTLPTGFEQDGFLCVYETAQAFERACAHLDDGSKFDTAAEVLSAADAARLCPTLSATIAGAILTRSDAHCDPVRLVTALADAARERGARICFGVEVLGITRRGRRAASLLTAAGELAVDQLVVAAGAWSAKVAADLRVRWPIQGGKGYHVEFEARDGNIPIPVYFGERRLVATPLADRLRITGMLQLAGTSLDVDRSRVHAIIRQAKDLLPTVAARPVTHVWRGLRPCTPDGLPLIGRLAGMENVVVATGHGMWGVQLAPVTGRLVADLLCDVPVDARLNALSPARFERLQTLRPKPAPWSSAPPLTRTQAPSP